MIPAACKDTLEQGGRAKPQSKCKLRARAALCGQGSAQPSTGTAAMRALALLASIASIDALSTGTAPIRLHVEFCQQ
jgi:hypothetical protein